MDFMQEDQIVYWDLHHKYWGWMDRDSNQPHLNLALKLHQVSEKNKDSFAQFTILIKAISF